MRLFYFYSLHYLHRHKGANIRNFAGSKWITADPQHVIVTKRRCVITPVLLYLTYLSVRLREAVSALSGCPQTKKSAPVRFAAALHRFRSDSGHPHDRNPLRNGENHGFYD